MQSFNEGENSMYTPTVLGAVMNPSSTELLPTEFTVDQAIYALQQTNYSTTDARKYLIDSLDGFSAVNNTIYQEAVGLSQYNEDGSNKRLNPCTILQNTYNKFYDQYKNVHDILRDISGGVIDMGRAKDENVRFQMKIASVCQIETATTSPACLKLATLDYDLLYSTTGDDLSTSRIAKLEMLNYTLFARSEELCKAMDSLFSVHKLLLCPSFAGSLPRCKWNSLGSGSDSGSAYMLDGLEVNGGAYLRLKLKQISPYFSVSGYAYLTAAIDQLASTLDIPTLNDFQTSDQRFAAVSNGVETIKSFMTSGA